MAEPINYTWVEMQRYLNNQMTSGEMHAFEKALMDDPFLADALEGYLKTDPKLTSHHLKDIGTQVIGQKEENTVMPLTQNTNYWWRVAAIVLLIVGAGSIYFFNPLINNATTDVAANKTSMPRADSIGPEVKPLKTPQLFSNKKEPALANKNTTPILKQLQKNEPNFMAATSTILDSAPVAANQSIAALKISDGNELQKAWPQARMMRKNEQEVLNQVSTEFKGKVVDQAGDPLAFAMVKSKKGIGAVTDSNGNFSIKTTGSILEVSIASIGYTPITITLNGNFQQRIQLQEKMQSLSEIVVTAKGSRKRFEITTIKNQSLNKETGYKPVKGWKHFNNYLLKSINEYRDAAEEYISGDVEIEFETDRNGKPVRIAVAETDNEQNANKAIELLKKGPLWKKTKPGTKAQLHISF